jgi:hypothetical protein
MVVKVNRFLGLLSVAILLSIFSTLIWADGEDKPAAAQPSVAEQGDVKVIQSFSANEVKKTGVIEVEDKTKRLVMFVMGVPLLILLLATAALGIAMGIYGKQVYVPHMICAGLSLTLALGHAIVGLVWFFPF